MHKQMAELAYKLTENSTIRGADSENVAAVRQWLRDIGSGKLIVGTPIPEKAKKVKELAS